jgi:nitroimidazol reductase NimA-like FMN-containing flavoprotein (pyridoxamine 5'-phosphate oxidase superfamily)
MTLGNLPSWIRPMRRQDRQIADEAQLWDILRSADVCRVAFCDENWPYIVPLNFGCLDGKLYFHSAASGLKLDLLKANPNICFEVDTDVEILPGAEACGWSARFRSVLGFGRMCIVEDPEEKRAGIKALVAQYTDREIEAPAAIPGNTIVLRVDVQQLTGKQSTGD